VAPPSVGSDSDRSSDSGSSDSSDSTGSSDSSTGSSKSSKSKDEAPGLPGLSDLTGGGNSHSGVGKLPSKEQTKGGDLVPSSTEQTPKPGLNLPLLLPILFPGNQPKGTG